MTSCPDCLKGNILPGEPEGRMTKIGSTAAYFSPATLAARTTLNPDSFSHSNRSIVLFSDVFGLPLKNCKIIADRLAKDIGCDVWVPDLFDGRPLLSVGELSTPARPGQQRPFLERLWMIWMLITRIHLLYGIRDSVVDSRAIEFIKNIKQENSYTRVGAVGFCFGGGVAIRIGSQNVLDSIVVAHPGRFNFEQVKAINIPCSWECAEEDAEFSKALQHQCEAEFKQREGKDDYVDYEFVEYKGTTHGFAARPNLGFPDLIEAFENCLRQTSNWFKKTL